PEEVQIKASRLLGEESDIIAEIEELHRFLSNTPNPDLWRKDQEEYFSSPQLFFKEYVHKAAKSIADYTDRIDRYRDFVKVYTDGEGFGKATVQQAEAVLKAMDSLKDLKPSLESLTSESLEGLSEALKALTPLPDLKGELAKDSLVKSAAAKINSCCRMAALICNGEQDREKCCEAFSLLLELEKCYDGEYRQIKESEGVCDFSDLERYALEILSLDRCKDYGRNSFDYIIVDEFQDSNDIQYEIFKRLSDGGKNLYLVGDVKQCIYAFRNSNPDIFAGLSRSPDYRHLSLNSNFRSSEDVIDTVNKCFGAFTPPTFTGEKWQDMTAARGIKKRPENKSELVIINCKTGEGDREALYVARRIEQMVEEGFTVHNGDNSERPCGYGDFAVLVRKNSTCSDYRKVFEEYNIPCVSVGDKAFTDLTEIKIALALLETVLYPNGDLSAAVSMTCPAYGFTAEDMAELKLLGRDGAAEGSQKITLYKSLSLAEKTDGALGEKARRFLRDMRLFRKTAADSVTEELIRKIYSVTELDKLMRVGQKGKERQENLRLLLHYAKNNPRPGEFSAVMKNISRSKLEMPQAAIKEQADRSVKIMTIHGSKGLQFPVVFVSSTNGIPPAAEKTKPFAFDRTSGAGICICDYEKKRTFNTLSRQLLLNTENDRIEGEELRLLYVAMTRAEEKLIVTSKIGIRKDEDVNPVYRSGSYFDFLYGASLRNPDAFDRRRITADTKLLPKALEPQREIAAPIDFNAVKRRLGYKYPYQAAVKTPAKFTATALGVNAEQSGENTVSTAFYMGLPLFMKEGKALTPKERGDIYHKVMEKLDFAAASAEAELERLEAQGEITSQERAAVSGEEIQAFLDSSLAKRAVSAEKLRREFPLFTTINAMERENASPADNEDLSFIQGVADMFFIENGEIVLADYKTNRNTTAEKLVREYKGQLRIYKKALEEMLGLRVKECVLFSFSLKKEIMVEAY
ncbi:MAG: UvrD-helicase domain-containing protein, partial [[Eubacterium] siraeum]|nr:UvrD-helicase domain-containing protein [[Eubacterium] siraeum]